MAKNKIIDSEVSNLEDRIQAHAQQIANLQQEIRRIKNQIRTAINAFNVKNG